MNLKKLYVLLLVLVVFFMTGCDNTQKNNQSYDEKFTVTFKDWDGKTISSVEVEKGQSAQAPAKPVREGHEFKSWDKSYSNVQANLEVTALYEEVVLKYTVTFKDWDGKTISSVEVEKGQSAQAPAKPVREGYEFKSWDKSYSNVQANLEVTALYEEVLVKYTITWKDEDGNFLSTTQVTQGQTPSYSYDKQDTVEWKYEFMGWSTSLNGTPLETISNATADATYFAIVKKEKQQYTITFETNGGSEITSIKKDYGSILDLPANPIREGYRFVSWCSDLELKTPIQWPITVEGNITFYASWNEQVDVKEYLKTLLNNYKVNPYSYIPETMKPGYSANLMNASNLNNDYSDFVSVSSIIYGGYGEQWKMVVDNLEQSKTFFNVLIVVEGLTTTSISTFNDYFDKNPSDTAHHNFLNGIYSVTIDFDGKAISYVLDYVATIPLFGEQQIQIALSMDITTTNKEVRIQIGDANALKYKTTANSYEFGIRYLGVRRAYFSVSRNENGSVLGHIYEYLTVSGKGISSAADFYINDDYVSVVGNKAGGMLGFTGYINELYNSKTGKLLGYEVKEVLKSITYNTLWFNMSDTSGITSIKYQEATDDSAAFLYVNGLSNPFTPKKVGGLGTKMLSRRFDIEFRTQYYFSYNEVENVYEEIAVRVPMFFVQEEYFETVSADVKEVNSNITFAITIENNTLLKIQADYDELIDVFIQNKGNVTKDEILDFIGIAVKFN